MFLFFFVILFTCVWIGFFSVLPYPFSQINVAFLLLLSFLLWKESGIVVWMSFAFHFFLELFTASAFGIVLFSGTMTMLIVFWLYQFVITNRSWYATLFLSVLALVVYRILFFLLIFLEGVWSADAAGGVSLSSFFPFVFWEVGLTSLGVVAIFFVLNFFSRRMSTALIQR